MLKDEVAPTILNEPSPCDDCPHIDTCGRFPVSCRSFHIYVNAKGKLDTRDREPSVYWFKRTFCSPRKLRNKNVHDQPIKLITTRAAP